MATPSNQVTLTFDKLTASNLKFLIKKFAKYQCVVTDIEAPNKMVRKSGVPIKSFTLKFDDGQQMEVMVKSDGTVFQVRLNKRVVPIKNVDNIDKAIFEMVGHVQDNAKAYQRAKIQRQKRKLRPPVPSITTTRRERIEKIRGDLREVTQANTLLEQQLSDITKSVAPKTDALGKAQKDLENEKKLTVKLEGQIEALQKEQGE